MHPIKRPKPGDTEEDLLKEQEEFLQGLKTRKVVPAAKVVKKSSGGTSSSTATDPVKNVKQSEKMIADDVSEDEDDPSKVDSPMEAVLFDIKERPFDPLKLKGFDEARKSTLVLPVEKAGSSSNDPTTRKKSLFARSFDSRKQAQDKGKSSKMSTGESDRRVHGSLESCVGSLAPGQVYKPYTVETVGDKIHPYLAGMTEEEILEEQRKLVERLDPKLVNFIKNRKHKQLSCSTDSNQPDSRSVKPMEVDGGKTTEVNSPSKIKTEENELPINPKLVEKFPGMDKLELTKLEWAGVVKNEATEKLKGVKTDSKSARFDFSGMLLPEKNDDPKSYEKALHHHGEEMERPGYTIEELLTLARSVNVQQRSFALETLGNIYAKAHTGLYDEILEQSVFTLLDYMDLIHTVRKGLDNVDSNSINAALSCLASLLYSELEEACLDAVYLWPDSNPNPLLSTQPDEVVNDNSASKELKDFEYLQLDLLDFLINRSEILVRIEYLLVKKAELFNEKGVTCILKILIRLARHSPLSVIKYERILKFVTENYVSPNWITLSETQRNLKGIPLMHALKLVRVLIESSVSNAMKLYNNYSILPSVMSYLAYDQWREQTHVHEVENLVLEAFKIWIGFLSFGIAIDEYLALFPVLMQFLTFYGIASELNSFDLHHSSHLFALLTQILCFGNRDENSKKSGHSHWDLVKDATSLIEKHSIKMFKILSSPHLEGTYSIDLAVLSLGKALDFITHSLKYRDKESLVKQFSPILTEFTHSNFYSTYTSNLISRSVILNKHNGKTRYPSNFASVDGAKWKGELNPIMRPNSPYHFIKYFFKFCNTLTSESCFEIVFNPNLGNYFSRLRKNSTECFDYFVRFELSCLYEMINILPKDFDGKFVVAYNSLIHVPSCCPDIFKSLLKVALETCCNPNDLEAVYLFYVSYFLGLTIVQPETEESLPSSNKTTKVKFDDGGHPGDGDEDTKVLFQKWSKKITEAHWIFHPLENLYKRVTSTPGYATDNLAALEQETRGCLSFIHHCLKYHCESIIRTPQDLVTVYCRICRVFMLGNPGVYIDQLTVPVLKNILTILVSAKVLTASKDVIFSKYKPSTSAAVSFFDFYTELVNEYFDNSYYNEIFAAYLFLPLRAPEDETVKNCFWKHEYLNCVKLSKDKIPIPLTYMTQNVERDQTMLSMFTLLLKRQVITQDRNPFLYEVVLTHLRNSEDVLTETLRKDLDRFAFNT